MPAAAYAGRVGVQFAVTYDPHWRPSSYWTDSSPDSPSGWTRGAPTNRTGVVPEGRSQQHVERGNLRHGHGERIPERCGRSFEEQGTF